MATEYYRAGLGSVGSYQVSGVPWVTGSANLPIGHEATIVFPNVARAVTIINKDPSGNDDIRVHFNATGSGDIVKGRHYITLDDKNDSITVAVKCKEIYISNPGTAASAFELIAELTGIDTREMFALTGSGLTD